VPSTASTWTPQATASHATPCAPSATAQPAPSARNATPPNSPSSQATPACAWTADTSAEPAAPASAPTVADVCTGGGGGNCTQCYPNTDMTNLPNCTCNAGTTWNMPAGTQYCIPNGDPTPCHMSCKTCNVANNANACTSCKDYSVTVNPAGGQCICPTGYYMDGIGICQQCSNSCFTCNGPLEHWTASLARATDPSKETPPAFASTATTWTLMETANSAREIVTPVPEPRTISALPVSATQL
jgi:hypothetical protein